jgi:hypothetical protein
MWPIAALDSDGVYRYTGGVWDGYDYDDWIIENDIYARQLEPGETDPNI